MVFLQRIVEFVAAKSHISMQVLKFLISGGVVALTELTLLYIFTDIFGIWYLFSLVPAFLVAFCVSFSLQKFWTFQDRETHTVHVQIPSYLLVALANLALNAALLYLLVQFVGVWYLFAQVLINALIAVWSFLIYKFIIFKKNERVSPQ